MIFQSCFLLFLRIRTQRFYLFKFNQRACCVRIAWQIWLKTNLMMISHLTRTLSSLSNPDLIVGLLQLDVSNSLGLGYLIYSSRQLRHMHLSLKHRPKSENWPSSIFHSRHLRSDLQVVHHGGPSWSVLVYIPFRGQVFDSRCFYMVIFEMIIRRVGLSNWPLSLKTLDRLCRGKRHT